MENFTVTYTVIVQIFAVYLSSRILRWLFFANLNTRENKNIGSKLRMILD